MPVEQCQSNGKPGYRWGESGACYTYTPNSDRSRVRARKKAQKQGQAIEISRHADEPGATKPRD